MTIKVFISHQSADSFVAKRCSDRLGNHHGIECYLDVIDPYINLPGEDLAAHIRREMGKCTQLLAVVSQSTKLSQWVPWEVGVATEKNFPLATFADGYTTPPEFLQKWPYLHTDSDLDKYAIASKAADRTFVTKRASALSDVTARSSSTPEFFKTLRASLGR